MLKFQIMWSRNSPFALISIGGIRHSKDPRFWVEQPNVNNTSKQSWVSIQRIRIKVFLKIIQLKTTIEIF